MNAILSIGLSLSFLFHGFTFSPRDIINIGNLVEHARFHVDTYGDNFEIFLSKHFGELQEEHNSEYQKENEHEKLPFSHHSNLHYLIELVLLPSDFSSLKVVSGSDSSSNFYYTETYSSIRESKIFQPPRPA